MRWLSYLNVILVTLLLLTTATFFLYRSKQEEIPLYFPSKEKTELPTSPFASSDDLSFEEGPLSLKWVPPQMQLPDLTEELQFFGPNGRPDAAKENAFHIGLKSSGEFRTIREGERVYLVYKGNFPFTRTPYREPITTTQRPIWGDDSSTHKGSYTFSPDNLATPLWIELYSQSEDSISFQVTMLDEKAMPVKTPEHLRHITLHLQEFPKSQTVGWEIGGYRADSTLLVRQKARWMGPDRFLEMHGGEEFSHVVGKERIDFYDGELPYSCFIGADDFLVWKHNRWITAKPDESTEGLPLLSVKRIEEKVMTFELWDALGRSKIILSLIRTKDHNALPNLSKEFKFVGAKTWAQFIVECQNKDRLTLKPRDWLVLTQEGWKKLDTPRSIDEYVEGKLLGPLFILDKLSKQNGRQVLTGHLFNTSRTEVEKVEIEANPTTSLASFYRTFPFNPPIKIQLEGEEE